MDFVFISGILWSMCFTRNYYACLVLLICNDHYSRVEQEGGKDAKIYNESWLSCFFCFFLTKTMELCLIHIFFCPCPFVSLSFPHDYEMSCSKKGGTCCCLHHKKCNKCFQWITGFNIDLQCRLIVLSLFFSQITCGRSIEFLYWSKSTNATVFKCSTSSKPCIQNPT